MKTNIHPNYTSVRVVCSCGYEFYTRSTIANKDTLQLDVCAQCHPFYTGKQKSLDRSGQVDKFLKRYRRSANNS